MPAKGGMGEHAPSCLEPMPDAVLAPAARVGCRSAEWKVRSLGRSSDGHQAVDVVKVSGLQREKEARFIVALETAAGSKVLTGDGFPRKGQGRGANQEIGWDDIAEATQGPVSRTITCEAPLVLCDRVEDDRVAWELFESLAHS